MFTIDSWNQMGLLAAHQTHSLTISPNPYLCLSTAALTLSVGAAAAHPSAFILRGSREVRGLRQFVGDGEEVMGGCHGAGRPEVGWLCILKGLIKQGLPAQDQDVSREQTEETSVTAHTTSAAAAVGQVTPKPLTPLLPFLPSGGGHGPLSG